MFRLRAFLLTGALAGGFVPAVHARSTLPAIVPAPADANPKRSAPFLLQNAAVRVEYKVKEPRFSVALTVPELTARTPFAAALNADLAQWAQHELSTVSADFRIATRDPANAPISFGPPVVVLYAMAVGGQWQGGATAAGGRGRVGTEGSAQR